LVPAKYRLGIRRVDEDREGLHGTQHVVPVAARGGAAEDADLAGVVGLSEIARDACVDVRLIGHHDLLGSVLLDQRALALVHRTKGFLGGHRRDQLIVIVGPWTPTAS